MQTDTPSSIRLPPSTCLPRLLKKHLYKSRTILTTTCLPVISSYTPASSPRPSISTRSRRVSLGECWTRVMGVIGFQAGRLELIILNLLLLWSLGRIDRSSDHDRSPSRQTLLPDPHTLATRLALPQRSRPSGTIPSRTKRGPSSTGLRSVRIMRGSLRSLRR